MPALWTYPWTLERDGLDDACETLADRGIDALNVASHYHSVRSMQPRSPGALFRSFPGGCYFDPGEGFADVPVEPPVNDVGTWDDPLASIVDGAHEHDVAVNAWTVCLHNTRLGARNPDYRIESAFGDAHDHSLCPSHSAVREYFAAVVDAITRRGVDEVQLESVGFPSAFHDHGAAFGHDKRQTVTTTAGEALLSQCFCDGCRAAAAPHAVDFERAQSRVRDLVRESFADPAATPPPIDELLESDPVVRSLFDFRASVVESLVERLADAAGTTPLNYYVMEAFGSDPTALGAAGVDLTALEPHLDRTTAMCYVADPETARGRIAAVADAVDLPVDAGVTVDPDVVDGRDRFLTLVRELRSATDGDLSVYHHTLATRTHLEWIGAAFD
ncbi:hypothetical protein [Halosimplex amylolyticum]|uniref:hypothetical protein n=1 Tax=Halosimplex amylolyticum TaxID=3396616 RepID=UPI003F57D9CF